MNNAPEKISYVLQIHGVTDGAIYHKECVRHADIGQNTILLLEILYKPFEPPFPCSVRLSALRYKRSPLGCARPEICAARRCLSCFSNYDSTCQGRWEGEGEGGGGRGGIFQLPACLACVFLFFSLHFALASGPSLLFFRAHFFARTRLKRSLEKTKI